MNETPIQLDQKDVTTVDIATLWSQTKRMLEAVLAENAALKQQLAALAPAPEGDAQ